jgi:chromosome segregation ATPase
MHSLPPVSQQQIDLMNKEAQKNFGVVPDEPVHDLPEIEEQSSEEDPVEAAPEVEAVPEQKAPSVKQSSYSKEENMALLRERARKAEAEREELMRQLQSYQQKPIQNQAQAPQETEELSIGADDLVEGKHLTKLQKKIRSLEEQVTQSKQQSQSWTTEARLKHQYPDFDKVVSASNIASLSEMYPDVAKTIGDSQDLYSKAVTAYTVIKNLGIYTDDFQKDKVIAAQNVAKPRPLTSIAPTQGDTPMSRANAFAEGLTDDLAKQLRQEMFQAMKNRY